jgi:enamine deaminase RidA (YjgF/YER057c/UK114 family)
MAAKIERLAAKSVFDPPAYTQTIKVTGAQTILFISGQVDYDDKGQPGHSGDFAGQAQKIQGRAAMAPVCRSIGSTTNMISHAHP